MSTNKKKKVLPTKKATPPVANAEPNMNVINFKGLCKHESLKDFPNLYERMNNLKLGQSRGKTDGMKETINLLESDSRAIVKWLRERLKVVEMANKN